LNAAVARLIYSSTKYDSVTPLLRQLHRLKAHERITSKLPVLVYRCLHGAAASYLAAELQLKTADHGIRSASISVSRRRSSFSYLNGLPFRVTSAPSLPVYSSRLRMFIPMTLVKNG